MMISNKNEECEPIRGALKNSGRRLNELIKTSTSGNL